MCRSLALSWMTVVSNLSMRGELFEGATASPGCSSRIGAKCKGDKVVRRSWQTSPPSSALFPRPGYDQSNGAKKSKDRSLAGEEGKGVLPTPNPLPSAPCLLCRREQDTSTTPEPVPCFAACG